MADTKHLLINVILYGLLPLTQGWRNCTFNPLLELRQP